MYKFSMQTLAYFSVCVLNENRISEACMVCSLQAPTGHFGVDRESISYFPRMVQLEGKAILWSVD